MTREVPGQPAAEQSPSSRRSWLSAIGWCLLAFAGCFAGAVVGIRFGAPARPPTRRSVVASAPSPLGALTATVQEVAARVAPSVVAIYQDENAEAPAAAGVMLESGVVVTALAAVMEGDEFVVANAGGEMVTVHLLKRDHLAGIAALRCDHELEAAAMALGEGDAPAPGSMVILTGAPHRGLAPAVGWGVVSALHRRLPGSPPVQDVMLLDARVGQELAGAAVCDLDGRLVGIALPPTDAAVRLAAAVTTATIRSSLQRFLETKPEAAGDE